MSSFPRSPRLVKGAIVSLDLPNPIPQVVIFQYNPDKVSRTLTPKAPPTQAENDKAEAVRLAGPPKETISLEIELDAADQLEHPDQNRTATMMGIYPQLAALEMIIYPKLTNILLNKALTELGITQVTPFDGPFTLFIWGPKRVLPVRITSLTINEQAHDPNLNPIRASITVQLQVLSYSDFKSNHPGYYVFMAHHAIKEAMSIAGSVGSIGAVGSGEISFTGQINLF